jgi:uncharacterized protein (TIGR03083 family)
MKLRPQYGKDPLITLDGSPSAIAVPTVRQRRRLADALASFTEEQWAHPSRCDGWSARDVIVHLDSTNTFWTFSITAGLRGEPSRILADFDPAASPAQLVAASKETSEAVLAKFTTSTDELVVLVESLDEADWSTLAEAPPGHVSISTVAHHALWDSWIHERDILVPLGIEPAEAADEIAACLRYAAALGPALAAVGDPGARGTLAIDATEPDLAIVVDVGERVDVRSRTATDVDLRLTGKAVDLVDALSIRRPFDQPIPDESAWLLRGVAEAFQLTDE